MTKGRLTRQELSWLLTQEAQNAAERLRSGVQVLRTQAPPPPLPLDVAVSAVNTVPPAAHDPVHHVDASLDALDDVMKMLSNLNQRSSTTAAAVPQRRGRIDLAALLWEIAPDARVSIEPGSGTEVFGDEADFRRMVQVMIGHASGEGSSATVRRDGDDVRISVVLGPDSSPTAETERAWLSRMAMRYGGRHELEAGTEVLVFPAEGDQSEREALRRELDEARKQGEVYARELAAVFERGEEVSTVSSMPPAPGSRPQDRFATITKICAGVAAELKTTLGPMSRDLVGLRRHEVTDEQLENMRHRVQHAKEMVASLASIGALDSEELAMEVDLAEIARKALKDSATVSERGGVTVITRGERTYVRGGSKAIGALALELVMHAVAATPRGGTVEVSVDDDPLGPRLVVDDAGQPLPASGRRAFLALETHAGAYGRPTGLPIFMAAELAACQGATLELSDSPLGGLRVVATFVKRA